MAIHKTVLLQETIDGLNLQKGSVVIDGTFGGGGHSKEIGKRVEGVRIIAIDQDVNAGKDLDGRISFHNNNFRNLDQVLMEEGVQEIDGLILDLGFSSDQLENSGRGFSFMKDEPLLMTMKANPRPEDLTAIDVVNTWSEENLADIIFGYGEEKYSRRIARAIVGARKNKKIETTVELAKIIEGAVGKRGKINPATKTFQAIRIAVNDELGALSEGLQKGFAALKVGGRMSVISFHSLEDRIVKRFNNNMREQERGKIITKKPITASKEEIKNNSRARSAKLRVLEKIK